MKNEIAIGEEVLYLTQDECKSTNLTEEDFIELVEEALSIHGNKELEMPAKIGIHHVKDSLMHAMPADVPAKDICGIKWAESFPDNPEKFNLPTTSGLTILNDRESGWPIAIMDAVWITERRTPAVSTIAAKYLSNPTDEILGIIGCGTQGKAHAEMLPKVMKNLKKIYIYDKKEKTMDDLKDRVEEKIDIDIVKSNSIKEVVKNSNTIVTATIITQKPHPEIKSEWVSKGQTLLLVDMHSIWEDEIMKTADKYLLDSIEEHELFVDYGYYPKGLPEIYGETGEVVAGIKKGRENPDELIVSNNVGMAVEDIVVAKKIYNIALEENIGKRLPI